MSSNAAFAKKIALILFFIKIKRYETITLNYSDKVK